MFIDFRVPPSTPWSMILPQAQFFGAKNTPLDFWNMYLVDFVNIWELGGHQGWGNLLSGLGEPAGRTRGNLRGGNIPLPFKK